MHVPVTQFVSSLVRQDKRSKYGDSGEIIGISRRCGVCLRKSICETCGAWGSGLDHVHQPPRARRGALAFPRLACPLIPTRHVATGIDLLYASIAFAYPVSVPHFAIPAHGYKAPFTFSNRGSPHAGNRYQPNRIIHACLTSLLCCLVKDSRKVHAAATYRPVSTQS